jgi:hypothetical protein
MEPAAQSSMPRSPARRFGGLALAAVVIVIASIASYMTLIENAWVRATGVPVWIGFAIAAILAMLAIIRDRRIWVRSIAVLTLAFMAFGVYAFFGLSRLPASSAPAVGTSIQPISLPDHTGRPMGLIDAARAGPTLLVFYRGFW